MLNEIRTISVDLDLNIEAYQFKGIMQKFFHICFSEKLEWKLLQKLNFF